MKKYIDVSNHQGVIDWEKVKASGIDGVILRAGYLASTARKACNILFSSEKPVCH